MRVSPAVRALGIVTLVVVALLGSAYALGRSLVPDRPPAGVTDTPRHAGPSPADDRDSGAGPSPSIGAPEGATRPGPAGTAGPENVDGLPTYGARSTTGTETVALTFDDGPDPLYTPQILQILREFDVTATFCVVGENALNYPELIRAIVADGHTLCNHTWDHDITLGARSPDWIRADLIRTSEAIRAAVPDATIAYYRQPGGAWTYSVVSVAEDLDMIPLHWTVDPADWQTPGADRISSMVINNVEPGAVVLLHDAGGDRQGTVDALYRILRYLTGRFHVEALPPGRT
ncbi:polysaccharide deacetylase family protein [Micromonospora sp. WMMA1363]|uniref:polysaccharide deacetylase family protein n=1 Tax=Micromonospora sp. WMMA1363 TaxID=3053985 RepID=UPI00259D14A5|nr:polysaccharide deacetylase family protein [Micromonospora sp. WMMA1363]MDM4721045.1 polysaccharide deacetylase family protein [Micromonospora sp. WMMA1363]